MATPRRRGKELEPVKPAVDLIAEAPTHDHIARRAYELYEQRGRGDGQHWDDWLRAERQLRGRANTGATDVAA
jgi:hypothetical protein